MDDIIRIPKNKNKLSMSNLFATAYKDKTLSVHAQKLEAWLISQIQPEDEDFKVYRIEAKQLQYMFNLSPRNALKRLDEITDELLQYIIRIKEDDKRIKYTLLSESVYHTGEGWCEVSIHHRLKPHLLKLKESGNFTQLELQIVLSFQSYHSYPIYKLLKSRLHKGSKSHSFVIELAELKEIIGCVGKYEQYYELQRNILKPVQREFAEKADINFNYEVQSNVKRKVISIKINITRKSKLPQRLIKAQKEDIRIEKQQSQNNFDISEARRQFEDAEIK